MSAAKNMRIDGVEYRWLGHNQLQNVKTNAIIDSTTLQAENIHLGQGNDQQGISIGNHTISYCDCTDFSQEAQSMLMKVLLFIGIGLLVAGSITLAKNALPIAYPSTFIGIGLLATFISLCKICI